MKIEVEIDEGALKEEVREIAVRAARGLLKDRYDLTVNGKQVAAMAKTKAAEMIASGEVQTIVAEVAASELKSVVTEITIATMRTAVRAELKAMKEREQLEFKGD